MTKAEWLAQAYPAFVRAIRRQCKPFLIEQIMKASVAPARSSNHSLKPTWIGIQS